MCCMIRTDLFEEVIREEIGRGCFVLNDTDYWVRMETHGRWTFEVEYEGGEFLFFFEDSVMSADGCGGCQAGSSEEAVREFREFVRGVVGEVR